MYLLDGEAVWVFGFEIMPFATPAPGIAGAFRFLHEIAAWLLVVLVATHIAGATRHAASRDGVLSRMIGEPR